MQSEPGDYALDLVTVVLLSVATLAASWGYGAGNTQLETFYQRRFRAEFKPAFEAWLQSRPAVNPQAAPGPFTLPEYRLALAEQATRLATEAERLFQEGQTANEHGDNYVLDTVVFGGVLFFAGISQQLRRRSMRLVLLGLAV